MGLAILFIMMFHSHHFLPFGNVGVDMFLICSGVGVYYSLSKGKGLGYYYHRRFLRVYPQFFIISLIFYGLINISDTIPLFYHLTTLDFWVYGCKDIWYVPCILSFYAFSPLLFTLLNKSKNAFVALIIFYVIVYALIRILFIPQFYFTTVLDRVPSFLGGMLLGKIIYEGTKLRISKRLVIVTVIISLILFACKYVGFDYDLFRYLLYPTMALALCLMGGGISKNKPIACKVLGFFGLISYEVYLIHERFLYLLKDVFHLNLMLSLIIAFICAIPLSVCFQRAYNKLVNK